MTTQGYRSASRLLLAQAREELEAGDVRQASEKGWGAAAQMVKAISQQRGWAHNGHRELFLAVRRLQDEIAEANVRQLFNTASSLHTNFYEDWKDAVTVARDLGDVESFVDLLEPLA